MGSTDHTQTMKLFGTFLISLVGARPQVVVQRDEFGINKQIQLEDGRELNIQRQFNSPQIVQQQLAQSQGNPGANHSNNDYEIIARSLMRRVDQVESQLQVQQQIFQNILASYVTGTEWFLSNSKPLKNTPQLTQSSYGPQSSLVNQLMSDFNVQMATPEHGYQPVQPQQQLQQQQLQQPQVSSQVQAPQAQLQAQAQLKPQPLTASSQQYVNTKLHDVKSAVPNKGILMVFYNGHWGTVCDDDFGSREANTACRGMGYVGAKRHSSSRRENQYRAPPNAPILLDEVECNETDGSLFDCQAQWNNHNCIHGEDVIVECFMAPGAVIRK